MALVGYGTVIGYGLKDKVLRVFLDGYSIK